MIYLVAETIVLSMVLATRKLQRVELWRSDCCLQLKNIKHVEEGDI